MAKPFRQTFVEHLDELRGRLVKSIAAVLLAATVVYGYTDTLLLAMIKPVGYVVFTSLADAFVAKITLSLYMGLLVTLPFVLYQLWQFVAIALKEEERKYIAYYGPFSLVMFLMGASFGYFVLVPMSAQFLIGFSSDVVVPMITIKNYISFVVTMLLAAGVIFELPLVLMFLTKIGVATPEFLIQKRRHAIVLILIISAVITPPDVITLLIMSGPLLILYEIGIVISKITYQQKLRLES